MAILKCLSLKQPWVWAIFNAGKDIENRTWVTLYTGTIYIHASKSYHKEGELWINKNIGIDVPKNLETGCILGSVELTRCSDYYSFGSLWAMPEHWHWKIENPVLLPSPIPAKGQLGIWNFNLEQTA